MFGTIISDKGGATAIIKLDGRHKPIPFHKAMLYAPKLSPEWSRLNGTQRDFSDFRPKQADAESINSQEPVASRLRSKRNQV